MHVGGLRQRALLALLLCHANQVVSRDELIEELLADQPAGAAVRLLRVQISRLRQVLADGDGPPRLVARPPGYLLRVQDGELDLQVFEQRAAAGRAALEQGDPGRATALLGEAECLWRGRPLADLEFESVARFEIQRLEADRLGAAEDRIEAQLALGRHVAVCPELGLLVTEHPLRERLRGQLMVALYRSGRQAEALGAYQQLRTLLVDELGIDPGADLRELHQQILAQDPALAAASPGRAAPALATRPVVVPREPNNLPAQVSSFIGRDGELAAVRRLITTCRLVTLTGAGGVGKTRLGLQVAAGLRDGFADGVWFADLAPLGDPDLVAVTVANVLSIREEPGRPLVGTLIDAIGQGRLLVLLDNCEHVLDACAKLTDALLRGCPNLALLATSRTPLGIDGERVHPVPALSTPADGDDIGVIGTTEAVRLFTDRATAQGVPLAWDELTAVVVGRICRRLDGIPLALELAAARLRAMPVTELDARLDERFSLLTGGSRAALPRQRTLRAMVDWSWELLNPAERAVLARLSVFAGGFGLAAAEAVAAGPDVPASEVLGHLGALVDKSLVQFGDTGSGPGRYRLLDTVRQYAAGHLDAGPVAGCAARTAHRDYYLAVAEAAAPHLVGPDQAEWLDRLGAELGNLRAAVAVSQAQADPELGLRLAAALRVFWLVRGHAAEGAGVLRALLDAPGAQAVSLLRARALAAAANLLGNSGGYAAAVEYCQEGLAIARAAGDKNLVAELLLERASALVYLGQPAAARPLIGQGVGLARRLGEAHLTARLLLARSFATYVAEDDVGAVRDAAEAVRLFRQAGDRVQVGTALGYLGAYELAAGDLDAARGHLAEGLHIARALSSHCDIVWQTLSLGMIEYLGGSLGAAQALFAESLDLARRMAMKPPMAYALLGLALAGHGGTDPGWSTRLHGAADQALADLGETLQPLEARLADRDRQRLRATMGIEAFEAEYAAGRTLTPEQIVDLAHSTGA